MDIEKRILLAKEVLNLLELKKIRPRTGKYFVLGKESYNSFATNFLFYGDALFHNNPNTNLQEILKQKDTYCSACLLGSYFAAFVNLYNNVTIKDENATHHYAEEIIKNLKGIFSMQELFELELYFEGTSHLPYYLSQEEHVSHEEEYIPFEREFTIRKERINFFREKTNHNTSTEEKLTLLIKDVCNTLIETDGKYYLRMDIE